MEERRRFVRLNIPLKVSYALRGKEGRPLKSVAKNISPGGMRFTVERELPMGTTLDIAVKIPTSPKPIPIKAKIAWSKKEAGEGRNICDAGFEFIQIPEESKNAFFEYMCDLICDQLKNSKW